MPTVNANKHTAHDLQLAGQMRREDYKTIKHIVLTVRSHAVAATSASRIAPFRWS